MNDIVLLQTMIIDIEGYFTIVRSSKPTVSFEKPCFAAALLPCRDQRQYNGRTGDIGGNEGDEEAGVERRGRKERRR